MSPGAVWWGNYLFRDTWKIPAGQMTAVAPLTWEGESEPSTGNEGGGLWGVSSHITGKQLENALTFATFVATDPAWQVELSTGLPGVRPRAGPVAREDESERTYFAENPPRSAAIQGCRRPPCNPTTRTCCTTRAAVWTETVSPTLIAGRSVEEAIAAFGEELRQPGQIGGLHRQVTLARGGVGPRPTPPRTRFEEEAMTTTVTETLTTRTPRSRRRPRRADRRKAARPRPAARGC